MSMANSQDGIKGKLLVGLAEQLEASIREAAREGKSLHEVEKDTFGRALQIGHAAIEQLLALQGDGDLGENVATADGRRLERSEEPAERPLRTVFGEHTIRAYVYAAGAHQAIELRPVDARLSLPPGRCSYFFEEFSQYFCVDQAFGQASQGMATVLRQEVSVDTLERINRRMGEQAKGFYPHGEHQEAFARDRLLRILQGEVRGVIGGLRQMATKRGLKGKGREEIADTWSRTAWSGAACAGGSRVLSRCFTSVPCTNPPTGTTFTKIALPENNVNVTRIAPS